MKRLPALLAAGSISVVPASWAAPASADPSICDTVVTGPVTLTSDLTCDFSLGTGGQVDLGGFTVTGHVDADGYFTDEGFVDDASVVNGSLAGGLFVRDAEVELADVEDVSISAVRGFVDAVRSEVAFGFNTAMFPGNFTVRDSTIRGINGCTDCGLDIHGSVVEDDIDSTGTVTLVDSTVNGSVVVEGSATIEGSEVSGDLVLAAWSADVVRNRVSGSVVLAPYWSLRMEENIVGGGATVEGATNGSPGVVAGNWFVGSSTSGLVVTGLDAGTVRVAGNLAVGNQEYGIDAPGVVDGGDNLAWNNQLANGGLGEQCRGVDCAPK